MDKEIKFGNFTISLPNEISSMFGIFGNLTNFFGVEYQSEAVDKLKTNLKELNLKPKPNIDFESDYTQIDSRSFETIFNVAKLINDLSISQYQIKFTEEELENIYNQLKSWKRPPRQKWKIGDVFSIPMLNNSYCFGEIVGIHLANSPILAMFEITKNNMEITFEELQKSKLLVVYNLDDEEIKCKSFKILNNFELLAHSEQVENKNKIGGVSLTTLANVYFGLEPWNVMYKEDYYDEYFLSKRPKNILWLNDEEKEKYRGKKFNL